MSHRRDPWWDADEESVAGYVCDRAEEIANAYSERYAHIERMFNLYRAGSEKARYGRLRRVVRLNTAAEACDAFASEVAGQPPALSLTVRDVSWHAKEQARYVNWYADAAYERQQMPDLYDVATKDSYRAGSAFVLAQDYEDGPRLERIHPCDMLIDDIGCSPRNPPPEWIVRHYIPRHVLAADYEEYASQIEELAASRDREGFDVICCYEAWFRDKRHVLAADGLKRPLVDEEWEGPAPISWLTLLPDERGLWGISIMDRIGSLQHGANYASKTIQRGLRWIVPHLLATAGVIREGSLTDDTKTVVEIDGNPQQVQPLDMRVASPEVFGREQWLREKTFEAGMASEMFASGQRQPGAKSGKAIRLERDLSVRRHLPMYRRVGQFGVRMYRELIRAEKRCSDKYDAYKVVVSVSGVEKNIAATALCLDTDTLQIRAMPAGALPLEASSRNEVLAEWFEAGLITKEEWHTYAEVPEFEKVRGRKVALLNRIDALIDDILYEGKERNLPGFLPPELQMVAVRNATEAYLKAQNDGAPKERLAMLEKWIAVVADRLKPPPPPPMMGPPGMVPPIGPPGGDGMPPPPPPGMPPPGVADVPPPAPGMDPLAGQAGNVIPIN